MMMPPELLADQVMRAARGLEVRFRHGARR
jgi:hypothetical protein